PIERAYALLDDERSRTIFREQLAWRITADFEGLGSPGDERQYFPPDVVQLRDDEAFVDCGAYDGDTLREFLSLTGGSFRRYWALEPDAENYAALTRFVQTLPEGVARRITCSAIAASDRRGVET